MTQDFSEEITVVEEAIAAVYENKQVNKKNSLNGDYSSDSQSYPTCQAVNNAMPTKTSDLTNDGDGTNAFVKTNDSRLTDARTPVSHSHGTADITDPNAHSHIGTTANATQTQINNALDGLVNIGLVKQATADTGYASTYYLTQNGQRVGVPIQIEKDKMLRSLTIETVGATPTTEEASYNMTTGDKYLLMIVNTVDNDGTTRNILPITDVFDLQTADNVTLELSAGGVFSIKAGGVGTTQLANGAVTSDKIDTNVKNSWLTESDVKSIVSDFANGLANAINPPANSS